MHILIITLYFVVTIYDKWKYNNNTRFSDSTHFTYIIAFNYNILTLYRFQQHVLRQSTEMCRLCVLSYNTWQCKLALYLSYELYLWGIYLQVENV